RDVNNLLLPCTCQTPPGNLSGCIFGEWRVLGTANGAPATAHAEPHLHWRCDPNVLWRCRCICGTEKHIIATELTRFLTLSCGCLADESLRLVFRARVKRAVKTIMDDVSRAMRRERVRLIDAGWTPSLQRELEAFQPVCVVCGSAEDLTNDHVVWF